MTRTSWLLPALLLIACGGRSANSGNVLEMETVVIGPGDDTALLETLTATELFDSANALLRDGEYEPALRRYQFLIERHPQSEYVRGSVYNSGLCFEGLDDWQSASQAYERVIDEWPATDDATDAFFRWAEARAQLGDWEGVAPLMERVLARARLSLVDRTEAHLRWANAAVELRQYAHAERHYRQVLRENHRAQIETAPDALPQDQPLADYHPIMVQANYGLGRTYHELFLEIKLILPQDEIARALVDKGQLLEQARLAYLDAVRAGHPYWSVAAGYMIGQLYEDFFLDVLACEVPREFDAYTLEVYFDELREFLEPVIERALSVYEDNLAMAERMGADSIWVQETRTGIDRVQRYLFDSATQEEQEDEIVRQRHPHGAQDPARAWVPPAAPPDS